jgi:hypothetical protein
MPALYKIYAMLTSSLKRLLTLRAAPTPFGTIAANIQGQQAHDLGEWQDHLDVRALPRWPSGETLARLVAVRLGIVSSSDSLLFSWRKKLALAIMAGRSESLLSTIYQAISLRSVVPIVVRNGVVESVVRAVSDLSVFRTEAVRDPAFFL